MWETLISKTNMEKDPKKFWEEIHRLMGHKKPKIPAVIHDEHNQKLTTTTEIAEAFRHRLYNTFRISDEENQNFSQEKEELVNRWHEVNAPGLENSPNVFFIYPKITEMSVFNVLKSFKEKSPGPSGITRNYLLKAPPIILKQYAEIYSASFATGYFPTSLKIAKIVMIPKQESQTNTSKTIDREVSSRCPGKI